MTTERHTALAWADQIDAERRHAAWPSRAAKWHGPTPSAVAALRLNGQLPSLNTRRYPRTLAEAWPQHHAWQGVITHHRRPLAERVASWIKAGAVLATFAGIGVLLAWRG